jgi:hypothetical protein
MSVRLKGGVELLVVALFAALVAVLALPLVPQADQNAPTNSSTQPLTP